VVNKMNEHYAFDGQHALDQWLAELPSYFRIEFQEQTEIKCSIALKNTIHKIDLSDMEIKKISLTDQRSQQSYQLLCDAHMQLIYFLQDQLRFQMPLVKMIPTSCRSWPWKLQDEQVLEGMGGTGKDSLLFLSVGASVITYERHPLMYYYLWQQQRLYQVTAQAIANIVATDTPSWKIQFGNFPQAQLKKENQEQKIKMIYLDPMFHASTLKKKSRSHQAMEMMNVLEIDQGLREIKQGDNSLNNDEIWPLIAMIREDSLFQNTAIILKRSIQHSLPSKKEFEYIGLSRPLVTSGKTVQYWRWPPQ